MDKANTIPTLNLRASITVEVNAVNYLEAARIQESLERHLGTMKGDFPEAWLSIVERRPPAAPSGRIIGEQRKSSGRLHVYDD